MTYDVREKEPSATITETIFNIFNIALNSLVGTHEGRGKEWGITFVIGDSETIMNNCKLKANQKDPLEQVKKENRKITSLVFIDWLFREMPLMEGGIVINEKGEVLATNRYFETKVSFFEPDRDGEGGGSRHAAAKSITSISNSIALVKSSENRLSFYGRGKLMMRAKPYVVLRPGYIKSFIGGPDDEYDHDKWKGSGDDDDNVENLWERLAPAFNNLFPDEDALYDIGLDLENSVNTDISRKRKKPNVLKTITLQKIEELVNVVDEVEDEEIFQDLAGEMGESPLGCLRDKWYHNIRKFTVVKDLEREQAGGEEEGESWDNYIY